MDEPTKRYLRRKLPWVLAGLAAVIAVFVFFGKLFIFIGVKLITKVIGALLLAIGFIFGGKRTVKNAVNHADINQKSE